MKRFLLNNLGLKLLALIIATALWVLVVGEKEVEVGFLVPLVFMGLPEDIAMVSIPPADIEVRVSGPKGFINKLSPVQIKADMNLSHAKEGINTFRIEADQIRTPSGIKVIKVRPSSVEIRMERLKTVTVPVVVELEGSLADEFVVARVIVVPAEVVVMSRKKNLEGVTQIKTRPVDIDGITSSKKESVRLEILDMGFASVEPDTVEVTVMLEEVVEIIGVGESGIEEGD